MQPILFDTHCHVNFKPFAKDADDVIQRALSQGTWLNNVGTKLSTSRRAVELAEAYSEGVFATVGVHPVYVAPTPVSEELVSSQQQFTTKAEAIDIPALRELAQKPKVVAIGEIGLDYFRVTDESAKKKQRAAFIAQLDLADELKKPVIIHCRASAEPAAGGAKTGREAHEDILSILENRFKHCGDGSSSAGGIAHFFTGTIEQAERYWALGFYIAFGGVITITRDYDAVVKATPLERIVIETDAPYVTPAPYRGKRNEPSYVKLVAQKLAELKNIDLIEIQRQTTQNALKVVCKHL